MPREGKVGAGRSRCHAKPKLEPGEAKRSLQSRCEACPSRGLASRGEAVARGPKPVRAVAGLGAERSPPKPKLVAVAAGASELVAEASLWRQVGPKVCCSSMYFVEVVALIEATMVL